MVEKFDIRSSKSSDQQIRNSVRDVKITAPVIPPSEGISNGHPPSASSPPPPNASWKTSPLYKSYDSDEDVPEIIKRLSDSAIAIPGQRRSDTLSSDIIVNSISTGELNAKATLIRAIYKQSLSLSPPFSLSLPFSSELEGLEQQLSLAREEMQRYKKAARLWKTRYEQEHRARYAHYAV